MRFNFEKLANWQHGERKRRRPRWYRIDRERAGELVGTLQTYRVRCGKARCRCASRRPEDAHEAVYRVWHEGGRTRKAYVKAGDVEAVRAAIGRRAARLVIERARRNEHMRRGMGKRKSLVDREKDNQLRGALRGMYDAYQRIQRIRANADKLGAQRME